MPEKKIVVLHDQALDSLLVFLTISEDYAKSTGFWGNLGKNWKVWENLGKFWKN